MTGAVGSGKSALAKALVGLYPLEGGEIRVNGAPLSALDAEERAALIGYLPQDPWLFSGTVRENVFGAEGLGDAAADLAALDDLVARAVPAGGARAGRRGVPGRPRHPDWRGRRARLGRAAPADRPGAGAAGRRAGSRRACWSWTTRSRPSTSTPRSRLVEGLLRAVGPRRRPGRATIVLCSPRLAAFTRVDLVVLLDDGKIVEVGSHAERLAARGRYAQIYLAQQRIGQAGPPWRAADERRRPEPGDAARGPSSGASTYRQVAGLLAPRKALLLLIVALVVTSASLELVPPLILRSIVDDHLLVGQTDGLIVLATWFLVAMAVVEATRALAGYLTRRRGAGDAARPAGPPVLALPVVADPLVRSDAARRGDCPAPRTSRRSRRCSRPASRASSSTSRSRDDLDRVGGAEPAAGRHRRADGAGQLLGERLQVQVREAGRRQSDRRRAAGRSAPGDAGGGRDDPDVPGGRMRSSTGCA